MCNSGKHCSKAAHCSTNLFHLVTEKFILRAVHVSRQTIPCFENCNEKLKALKNGAMLHAIASFQRVSTFSIVAYNFAFKVAKHSTSTFSGKNAR